ncbi:phosphate starvation-inducible protein PsiF [Bacillus sp. SRB_336]|nr:phosphate starvation-inducible protein PsiF [Bacillus sp. SRB_336]
MSMSLRLLAASAAFAFAGATFAATPAAATATATAKPHTAQQQRMINCNKQATGKKGAERKTFMSTCLKSGGTAAASAPAAAAAAPSAKQAQQGKMTTCNAEAKSKALKGAERKAFMSTCLKGNSAAAS